MPKFSYTARNSYGEVVIEVIEAENESAALDILVSRGLEVEGIHAIEDLEEPITFKEETQTDGVDNEEIFAHPIDQQVEEEVIEPVEKKYVPLLETLTLYAGWLLAWYCLVYALGYYQNTRDLPFRIPFVEGLFLSPLVLSFTLVVFIFLTLKSVKRIIGKGILSSFFLLCIGITVFFLYRINAV